MTASLANPLSSCILTIKTGAWNTIIYRNTMWSNINDILEVILQENRYACMQNKCLGNIYRLLLLLYLSTTVLSPVFSTPRSESQRFQSETCEVEKSLGLGRSVGLYLSGGIWGPMGSMGLIDYPSIFGEATRKSMGSSNGRLCRNCRVVQTKFGTAGTPIKQERAYQQSETLHADSKSS